MAWHGTCIHEGRQQRAVDCCGRGSKRLLALVWRLPCVPLPLNLFAPMPPASSRSWHAGSHARLPTTRPTVARGRRRHMALARGDTTSSAPGRCFLHLAGRGLLRVCALNANGVSPPECACVLAIQSTSKTQRNHQRVPTRSGACIGRRCGTSVRNSVDGTTAQSQQPIASAHHSEPTGCSAATKQANVRAHVRTR